MLFSQNMIDAMVLTNLDNEKAVREKNGGTLSPAMEASYALRNRTFVPMLEAMNEVAERFGSVDAIEGFCANLETLTTEAVVSIIKPDASVELVDQIGRRFHANMVRQVTVGFADFQAVVAEAGAAGNCDCPDCNNARLDAIEKITGRPVPADVRKAIVQ